MQLRAREVVVIVVGGGGTVMRVAVLQARSKFFVVRSGSRSVVSSDGLAKWLGVVSVREWNGRVDQGVSVWYLVIRR